MNIKEAKETIQYTLQAYFQKDENGYPLVPLRQQRPILLIGPPGIGKTAIMEQIAGECGAGLVAYTMTHHTRQSAMGLPKIVERTFDDAQVSVTEYTMSEIIASIYACMEKTGKKRGILFLDEINCVSETLAPVMLQLLQDKTFGNQKLPPDWLIVAAGNPPEYNKSVREFDIATLDRVRKIVLEPDLDVWMEYALFHQVHGSIRSYLEAHRDRFYRIRQEDGKKQFVTARGWEDLSAVLKSYEKMGFPVGKNAGGAVSSGRKDSSRIFFVLSDLSEVRTGLPDQTGSGRKPFGCGTGDDHPDGTGGNTTGAQYGTGVSAGCAGSEHRTVFQGKSDTESADRKL